MEKLLGGLWCGVVTNDIEPLIQFLEAGALLLGRRNGIAHDGEHHTIRLCTCFKCKQTNDIVIENNSFNKFSQLTKS